MNELPPEPRPAAELQLDVLASRAEHFLSTGRVDLAERLLRDGLARDPESAPLITLLARCAFERKDFAEATRLARDSAALDPESLDNLRLLGDIGKAQGRSREAEEYYLAGLRMDPFDIYLLYSYAGLLYKVNELEKAERVIRESLRIDPESPQAQSLLALILARRDRNAAAVAAGAEGLRMAPDEDFSHAAAGFAYLKRGRPLLARRHLREAIRQNPEDDGLVEAFEEADLLTRWIMLPYYYYSLVIDKIPGANFGLWGIFIAGYIAMQSFQVPPHIESVYVFSWVGFAIYTWVALPLGKLWVKVRPAR